MEQRPARDGRRLRVVVAAGAEPRDGRRVRLHAVSDPRGQGVLRGRRQGPGVGRLVAGGHPRRGAAPPGRGIGAALRVLPGPDGLSYVHACAARGGRDARRPLDPAAPYRVERGVSAPVVDVPQPHGLGEEPALLERRQRGAGPHRSARVRAVEHRAAGVRDGRGGPDHGGAEPLDPAAAGSAAVGPPQRRAVRSAAWHVFLSVQLQIRAAEGRAGPAGAGAGHRPPAHHRPGGPRRPEAGLRLRPPRHARLCAARGCPRGRRTGSPPPGRGRLPRRQGHGRTCDPREPRLRPRPYRPGPHGTVEEEPGP